MILRFTKMHGLGNDFVVIDLISQRFILQQHQIKHLADRHFGVGCDQVLLVEPPRDPQVDFRYRIFNPDGSEVEQCGNGARCFANFVREKRLTGKQHILVETAKGKIELQVNENSTISVNMGVPELRPAHIPFKASAQASSYKLKIGRKTINAGVLSMGNPHLVYPVDNIKKAPVGKFGPTLERHSRFPQGVNVGFMELLDRSHIKLRVFERGAGETLACGSGACAAVVYGRMRGWLDQQVEVELPGGKLQIEWAGDKAPVLMSGPATTVYEGKIRL